MSDDIEVHYPAPEGLLPWAGDWTGFEGFLAFLKTLGDHLVIDRVEPLAIHVAGDTVITVLKGEWTVKADRAQGSAPKQSTCSRCATARSSGTKSSSDTAAAGTGFGKACRGVSAAQSLKSLGIGPERARKQGEIHGTQRRSQRHHWRRPRSCTAAMLPTSNRCMPGTKTIPAACRGGEWQSFFAELKDDPDEVRKSARRRLLEAGQLAGSSQWQSWSRRSTATGVLSKRPFYRQALPGKAKAAGQAIDTSPT